MMSPKIPVLQKLKPNPIIPFMKQFVPYVEPCPYIDWAAMERDKSYLETTMFLAEEKYLSECLHRHVINTHPRASMAFYRLQCRNPHISRIPLTEQKKYYRKGYSTRKYYIFPSEASETSDAPANFDFGPYRCEGSPYDMFDLRDAIDEAIVVNSIRSNVALNGPYAIVAFDRMQAKGQFFLG